jgi:Trp operon repressor
MIYQGFMWEMTGNKWLDGKIRAIMDFNSELNSLACHNSPLTRDEMETLNKRFKSINLLLNRVAKREAKKRNGKTKTR